LEFPGDLAGRKLIDKLLDLGYLVAVIVEPGAPNDDIQLPKNRTIKATG